jgi:polyisoprenoid-binding protein YceI
MRTGLLASAILAQTLCANPGDNGEPVRLAVSGGVASFVANTNVPAVSIKGKSSAMTAEVNAVRAAQGLLIEHIQATVPVKTLQTGMGLRDEHMRKYIFTLPDGQTPDMVFQADGVTCPAAAQSTCQIDGTLAIRGVSRPFRIALKFHEDGKGFKATGDSTVKLSDYGIPQPSQYGVKTEDVVAIKLDFTAAPSAPSVAANGGVR